MIIGICDGKFTQNSLQILKELIFKISLRVINIVIIQKPPISCFTFCSVSETLAFNLL